MMLAFQCNSHSFSIQTWYEVETCIAITQIENENLRHHQLICVSSDCFTDEKLVFEVINKNKI